MDDTDFKVFDVGGQRSERRKWIHCFEDVTAVIFVAAISEYDQKLFEDGATNRMVEALELFEEVRTPRAPAPAPAPGFWSRGRRATRRSLSRVSARVAQIVGNRCFMRSTIILFLNKRDLFAEKIKKHPIASIERFNDFTGGDDFDLGCKYFEQKFVDKHHEKCGAEAVLYKHVTCATDTANIKIAMDAAKRTILEKNFAGAGLL